MSEKVPYRAEVSVVVPVFNSAATLPELHERLSSTFTQLGKRWEVIYVFDGGAEDSWTALKQLKRSDPDHVTAIRLARNFGQHNATLCGIGFAAGDWIVTLDDDLQIPPEEIKSLLDSQAETGSDLTYGIFRKKKHSWFRNLGSKLFKKAFRYLVNGVPDGSSFRLMSRSLADQISQFNYHHVFLDQLLSWYTMDIGFQEVIHESRKEGKSGYTSLKLIRMALDIFISYTDLPLRLMTWAGIISSILSLVLGTFFIIQRLAVGSQVGFTALISSIFFTGGIILMCLGILGEYISRIYQSRIQRPAFAIKAIL